MSSLGEIETFVAVVAAGSFTRAARRLGVSQSLVSRSVAALEARLAARLLHRTTRKLQLTTDGQAFYERCARVLAELQEAELTVSRNHEQPRGLLRVDAPSLLGLLVVIPALPGFFARHPEVKVQLTLRDHYVDIVGEGLDVALRMGDIADSSFIARKLGMARVITCATPSYLERRGRPRTLEDLARHDCLVSLIDGVPQAWLYGSQGQAHEVAVSGPLHVASGPAVLESARAGLGLVRLFDYVVAADIAAGRLEEVLAEHSNVQRPVSAVYPASRHLSPKVRVFVDYMVEIWARLQAAPATGERSRAHATPGGRRRRRDGA
jgi:DNA-binding transcriptional LysR family regulator